MANSRVTLLNKNYCSNSNDDDYGSDEWWRAHVELSTKNILAPFRQMIIVFKRKQHPTHISLEFMRKYLRVIGLWPKQDGSDSVLYKIFNKVIMLMLIVFILTISCDLYEASADIVLFGDDLVVLLGLYLILFKIYQYRNSTTEIEEILLELNRMHTRYGRLQVENRKIRNLQRRCFLMELLTFTCYLHLAFILFAAMSIQPFFSDQPLPYRAKFPFELHNPDRHPWACNGIYVFQCFCTIFSLAAIIFIDNIGCHIFSQITLSLRILCLRIRKLGVEGACDNMWQGLREIIVDHQHIIALIERINRSFYLNFLAQMAASTFIICLTAFEALLAKGQPLVALKFQIYMLAGFSQLFYWCLLGNLVYFDSLEVATAAFEINNWFTQSQQFQRSLLFLIQRAQKPLTFRAKPFYAFEIQAFTCLLSTSYSYFALLRTMND